MIDKYLIVGLVIAGLFILFAAFDSGRTYERGKASRQAVSQAMENIDIERQQNEVRNRPISDDDFINVLRRGGFGRLEN